jgi:sugar/nucleoside kinase (ribokinase family)
MNSFVEKTIDVIGFSNPMQDLLVELDRLPRSNQNLAMREYCFQGGGNVPTALVTCGMLGMKAAMLGVVGDDIFGYANLADFAYNHVDTSHVIMDPGTRTDFCIAVTERAIEGKEFISKRGTCREIELEDLDEDFLRATRIMHIGYTNPVVLRACEIVRAAGGKISIDAAYYRPDIYQHYDILDIFIASETYYNTMQREMGVEMSRAETCRYIRERGPEIVIFTFGTQGCFGVYGKDQYFETPAFTVETVDSTGAGDVFHGAFNYGYLKGWTVPEIARFCSACSAIKCTRQGGRAGIPTLGNVLRFLETGEIDTAEIDRRESHYKHGFFGQDMGGKR